MVIETLSALNEAAVSGLATLDPGVTPNFSGLPGIAQLRRLAGGFVGVALIVCVIAVGLGGALLGIGKAASRSTIATAGGAMILGGLAGAVVAAGSSALVAFFSNIGSGI